MVKIINHYRVQVTIRAVRRLCLILKRALTRVSLSRRERTTERKVFWHLHIPSTRLPPVRIRTMRVKRRRRLAEIYLKKATWESLICRQQLWAKCRCSTNRACPKPSNQNLWVTETRSPPPASPSPLVSASQKKSLIIVKRKQNQLLTRPVARKKSKETRKKWRRWINSWKKSKCKRLKGPLVRRLSSNSSCLTLSRASSYSKMRIRISPKQLTVRKPLIQKSNKSKKDRTCLHLQQARLQQKFKWT